MSKKTTTLVGEVAATLAVRQGWWDRLPEDARTELVAFRRAYQSGEYGTAKPWSVASALIKAAEGRGWKLCSEKQLANWLTKRD